MKLAIDNVEHEEVANDAVPTGPVDVAGPIMGFKHRAELQAYADPLERTGLFPWGPESERQIAQRAKAGALSIVCYVEGRTMLPSFTDDRLAQMEADGEADWRETVTCPSCGMCARQRFVIHVLDTVLRVQMLGTHIYLTECGTTLEHAISARYPRVLHSEYVPDLPRGSMVRVRGDVTRNEDLTRLSFPKGAFDLIASFDILEHIPDYRAALAEMARCVNAKGALLLSAPFDINRDEHLVRARLDAQGEIEHLCQPEYHTDPNSELGVLCFYHFGWDLLDELRALGFDDVQLLLGQSAEFGYFGWGNIMILARRTLCLTPLD